MYDLTRTASGPAKTSRDIIRQLLRSPFSIATVIPEATHQIAFNTGMHRRFSDNPVWLTEGMAMYFETPDLSSRSGWRAIGQENPFRIASLKGIPANDASLDLSSLIGSDQLFTDPRTAVNAYAVSRAFSRFLLTTRRREYLAFLEHVAGRKPLDFGSPQRRISEFEEHVEELSKLQPAFNRYLRALLR